MTIHPQALKVARERRRFTQQDLADECSQRGSRRNISVKAIYRYEKGETEPSAKKAQWLAEALGTTVEELSREPAADAAMEASLRSEGYVRTRAWLRPDVALNYRLVVHHYGVSLSDLINAAPWMFGLLAEMSLADRKQRLAEANTALQEAMTRLPDHLRDSVPALRAADFEESYDFRGERASIADRDIFGNKLLGSKNGPDYDPFNPFETNPFVDFVRRKASEIASDAIDVEQCGQSLDHGGLPEWSVFEAWLQELVGEDWLAKQAIERGRVKLGAIPQELLSPEKRDERVAWLIDQIPADERARLDKDIRNTNKSLEELGL